MAMVIWPANFRLTWQSPRNGQLLWATALRLGFGGVLGALDRGQLARQDRHRLERVWRRAVGAASAGARCLEILSG